MHGAFHLHGWILEGHEYFSIPSLICKFNIVKAHWGIGSDEYERDTLTFGANN